MVMFCMTMYFQSSQPVQMVNWDQYKNLQYNEERSHSLADLEKKLSPYNLEDLILDLSEKNRLLGEKTRVMELGHGNGRVLMELKKKFPDVEFYGINKEKTHTFYRRESFMLTALKFEIFNKEDLELVELPYVLFQDLDFGARIPYEENKFDVIFSQNMISHIRYKFELLNEIMRVLKPGGTSFHSDLSGINIYSSGMVLDQKDAIGLIRKKGIEITMLDDAKTIRFKKKEMNDLFPLTPHQPLPTESPATLSAELKKPDMGYNLNP